LQQHRFEVAHIDVGVDGGGFQLGVAEHGLDVAQPAAVLPSGFYLRKLFECFDEKVLPHPDPLPLGEGDFLRTEIRVVNFHAKVPNLTQAGA
jgi:hypothetical protein